MSAEWKVRNSGGALVASCLHAEDAAAVVSLHGKGATVTYRHQFDVWREGYEEFSAADSYDDAAKLMYERREMLNWSL